ncbi:MAG: hypothetical protein E7302_06685 [Butyrivibrio sp.]|nr:hypothetical protein [Butyrivibrio sp.]
MAKKTTTDKIMDIAKTVTEAAEPYIEMAKEKSGPVIEKAKEKSSPVIEEMLEKAEPVLSEVKKRTDPATKAVKKQSAKAADAVKAVESNLLEASSKKNTKTEFFVQYKDYEIRAEDIAAKIREDYIAEGNKASDIKELQVYLKPEENAAYYVINHKDTGKLTY